MPGKKRTITCQACFQLMGQSRPGPRLSLNLLLPIFFWDSFLSIYISRSLSVELYWSIFFNTSFSCRNLSVNLNLLILTIFVEHCLPTNFCRPYSVNHFFVYHLFVDHLFVDQFPSTICQSTICPPFSFDNLLTFSSFQFMIVFVAEQEKTENSSTTMRNQQKSR